MRIYERDCVNVIDDGEMGGNHIVNLIMNILQQKVTVDRHSKGVESPPPSPPRTLGRGTREHAPRGVCAQAYDQKKEE